MYLAFFPMSEVNNFESQCSTDKDAIRFLDKLEDFKLYNMESVADVHQFVIDNNSGELETMLSFSFDFGKDEYQRLMDEIVAENEAKKVEVIKQLHPWFVMFGRTDDDDTQATDTETCQEDDGESDDFDVDESPMEESGFESDDETEPKCQHCCRCKYCGYERLN